MRNISFHLTTPQFVAGTKDVTRRGGWVALAPGEVLCAVEKGQGIPKGESIKRLGHIITVDCRRERLDRMTAEPEYGLDECRREGFPDMRPEEFVEFFCGSHDRIEPSSEITRIEFRKVPVLRERKIMHAHLQGGALYGYEIFDPALDAVVGTKTVEIDKRTRPWTETPTYVLLGSEGATFASAIEFIAAYEAQPKDTRR